MRLELIYEDNHLLLVNKPAGLLSQGDKTGDRSITDLGKDYLKEKYNKPGNVFCGLPHRLDRPVSGIMVLAKTSKALERLNKMFKEDQIDKTYLAAVNGMPAQVNGKLEHWLRKDPKKNLVKAFNKQKSNTKKAVLKYSTLLDKTYVSLLEVKPISGRSHQIRTQLSSIGHPIIGDIKYGGQKSESQHGEIALHAWKISFIHPVKKEPMEFTVDPKRNTTLTDIFDDLPA